MAPALRTRAVDFDEVIDSFDLVEHVDVKVAHPLHKCKYKDHIYFYIHFFQ
jgi:hypothetical protein